MKWSSRTRSALRVEWRYRARGCDRTCRLLIQRRGGGSRGSRKLTRRAYGETSSKTSTSLQPKWSDDPCSQLHTCVSAHLESGSMQPFHLAIPVHDLAAARAFYGGVF